jgi:hypothetical protein
MDGGCQPWVGCCRSEGTAKSQIRALRIGGMNGGLLLGATRYAGGRSDLIIVYIKVNAQS